MKAATALNLVMAQLGNRTEVALRTNCLLELIIFQAKLETSPWLPWFTLSEDATTTCLAGERRVPVPLDFIREADEGALYVVDAFGVEIELHKSEYDLLVQKYGHDTQGELPLEYALLGEYIHLFPIPQMNRTLQMKYHQRLEEPVDTLEFENAWLKYAPDLMIAGTAYAAATKHVHDNERALLFKSDQNEAYERLRKLHYAREEANRMRSMGED